MSRAVWQLGQAIRECGIALERAGARLNGDISFAEPRTCPPPSARFARSPATPPPPLRWDPCAGLASMWLGLPPRRMICGVCDLTKPGEPERLPRCRCPDLLWLLRRTCAAAQGCVRTMRVAGSFATTVLISVAAACSARLRACLYCCCCA